MITKLVRAQLVVFSVLAVASLVYGLLHYVGIQRLTGVGTYRVTAEFVDSNGLYPGALVTYRGVDVGHVTEVDLAGDAVRISLQLRGGERIPADTAAAIKSMSAIGEQYVDLTPSSDSPPYLGEGAHIPRERTTVAVPTGQVLDKTQMLLRSVSTDALRSAVDETFQAVNGVGPTLAVLIESSADLLDLAQADIGPTRALIDDVEPLLRTGNSVRTEIRTSMSDLASFTDQLARSDAELRAVLDQGPSTADTVAGTLADLTNPLPVLLSDLQTVGQVLRVNLPGLRQVLVVYPAVAAAANYSVSSAGFQTTGDLLGPQAPLDVKLGNTLNPPPCTEGYQSTQRRDPSDTGPAEVTQGNYCQVAPDNPKVARGARNIPCAVDPSVRAAEVADCPGGLPSTWPEMLSRPGGSAPAVPPGGASTVPAQPTEPAAVTVPYAEGDGTFRGPDGLTYILGVQVPREDNGKEPEGWLSLLIK
ncbi:MCE family protein [Nocardia puris]|uniref:MCE family protein n=1 Tax=Nocardia puris TaxID=208602 RepID=UPI0018937979|nr:MlaD family protein [Nocardia puris]MBF6215718.1 MCE family protein [Nocardia puris]